MASHGRSTTAMLSGPAVGWWGRRLQSIVHSERSDMARETLAAENGGVMVYVHPMHSFGLRECTRAARQDGVCVKMGGARTSVPGEKQRLVSLNELEAV